MSSSPTSLSSSEIDSQPSEFDALGDLVCKVTVVLGTGMISVRDCLDLELLHVLRLSQSAGEDLRVMVNGVAIAKGEVAIIDTSTAIRVTDLAPAARAVRR